ncbi:MAG: hypothetical protein HFH29_06535 [Eubacterium sp.]|nr:hypothetical protein [Eubacterium sp.]
MITARDYEKFSMDDRAVIADDFFPIPLLDGSEEYEYDEQEMKKSIEKARLAGEYCRKFEEEEPKKMLVKK